MGSAASAARPVLLIGLVLAALGLVLAGILGVAGQDVSGRVALGAIWVLVCTPPVALVRGAASLGGAALARALAVVAILALGIVLKVVQ